MIYFLGALLTLIIFIAVFRKKKTNPIRNLKTLDFDDSTSLKKKTELYFEILIMIQEAVKKNDIPKLLMHCQGSYSLLESLIEYTKLEYGKFDIKGIPAISYGLIYFSIFGKYGQLENIKELVNGLPELKAIHQEDVEEAYERAELSSIIFQFVKDNPNCKQIDLKKVIDTNRYGMVTSTVNYMVKANQVKKSTLDNRVRLSINEPYE